MTNQLKPKTEEDPQLYPPDPCAESATDKKKHQKEIIDGGLVYRVDIPKNLPPDMPFR